MLRIRAFVAALLVGWGFSFVAAAQEKAAYRGALPPSVADTLRDTKIEAILRQPCTLDIDESSLQDAVDYVKQKHEIEIKLDQKALVDQAIDASVLFTFHVKDLPLESALELMLEDFDLTYVIQHGVLKITSVEKAKTILTTRVYPVADLTKVEQAAPGARPRSNLSSIIQLIEDTISPDSWDTNSGAGSIKPFRTPGGMALVIANSRQVHLHIASLLADLRAVKPAAGGAEQQAIDSKAPYRVIYEIGAVSGPAMVKAITASVSPESWERKGGAGVICAVPVSIVENLAPTEAKIDASAPPRAVVKHWKLVVLQTNEAHRQIDDLLAPLAQKLSGLGCMGGETFASVNFETGPTPSSASAPSKSSKDGR